MPDILDASGLTVKTAAEITASLVAGLQGIYGADIDVDQNGQDGQSIGIVTQACVDIRDLLVQINNSFDPDQAVGTILDQRLAINNLRRQGGTYTIQPITLNFTQAQQLQGLDANFNDPNGTGYTVQDNNGNKFILVDSDDFTAGFHTVDFRAQQIGNVNVPLGSITSPVTVIPTINSINNTVGATTIGQNQETDPQGHLRRSRAPALANSGYLNGLLGKVLDLTGVTGAALYENRTDNVDANGIPAHGIWLVAAGGANTDIANLLYNNKSDGANMKGDVAVTIPTPSDVNFIAQFDRPVSVNLYIRFHVKTTVTNYNFDTDAMKAFIVANLTYQIGQFAETSALTQVLVAAVQSQGGGGVPVLAEISLDGIAYTDFILAPTLNAEFVLSTSLIAITVDA